MYGIINSRYGTRLTDYNTGKPAEFVNYDEAQFVLGTINRYTEQHYAIVNLAEAAKTLRVQNRYEPIAHNSHKSYIDAGYEVSMVAYNAETDAYEFDVYPK